MKKIRAKWMRLYTAVCAAVLGALGFTACDYPAPKYGPIAMYAPPPPEASVYKIKGRVTDEAEQPVQGIKVTVHNFDAVLDTAYTDVEGEFVTDKLTTFDYVGGTEVVLTDVDGEENGGRFAPDTVKFEEMKVDTISEEDWGGGEYELSFERKLKKETGDEGEGEKN
ncbi:MAG: radical SAM-associated putative lipoprotein [bacterium]|uniref:Radical SAM-associated putative lipoprotein n=1 Tax=Candidatus Aphodosoma intestinipullorum TaxID=2840674 RepID=A0A940IET4_9BACT|nr:radical SAM-associated putative lipoprotein [Candidatus Aphodosoma intestinipullorum]